MLKNPYVTGLLVFAATMTLFFIAYFFFSDVNYYTTSLNINSFVLPVIYTGAALLSVRYAWKRSRLTFKEAFIRSFIPMFIGGLLSFLSIFLFLNYADPAAKDLLNYQFIQKNKAELVTTYTQQKSQLKSEADKAQLEKDYQKSLQSFSPDQIKDKDMFTASHFSAYFAATLIYYVIISVFFGAFFKSKSLE